MSRHKADLEARKRKKEISQKGKEKVPVESTCEAENTRTEESPEPEKECREESPPTDTEMELESTDWT